MSDWTVRKVADQLRPGDRFIFAEDMGGEGEVLTVEGTANSFGTIEVATEEKDFIIEAEFNQMVTLAPEEERRGITLTREQLEAWAGRPLTDEQVEMLEEAIPNSSIPDAVATVVDSFIEED